ncbi:hypothetical protein DFH06DRAFT_1185047 [Mycena polygramma]|nr:hypothetical protein DFH06DRAFT_1185047 [Mycena polygramma]
MLLLRPLLLLRLLPPRRLSTLLRPSTLRRRRRRSSHRRKHSTRRPPAPNPAPRSRPPRPSPRRRRVCILRRGRGTYPLYQVVEMGVEMGGKRMCSGTLTTREGGGPTLALTPRAPSSQAPRSPTLQTQEVTDQE